MTENRAEAEIGVTQVSIEARNGLLNGAMTENRAEAEIGVTQVSIGARNGLLNGGNESFRETVILQRKEYSIIDV